jgi:hypothetical protein
MATSVKHAVQEEGVTTLRIVVGFLIMVALVGCSQTNRMSSDKANKGAIEPGPGKQGVQATPPPSCPDTAAPIDKTKLQACLNGLQFDAVAAVGDEQRLLVHEPGAGAKCHGSDTTHSCRHGPLAKIEPVKEDSARDTTALNQGVIIAKLFLRSGETESYPKLGLAPKDTTYWWIRRLTATTALSMYVRRSKGSVVHTPLDTITIELHPDGTFQQGLARFIWDDNDETTQGRCGSGCCKP